MRSLAGLMFLGAFAFAQLGCTICCSPYDYDYMSAGTQLQREDMVKGRVGSNFSDPNFGGVVLADGEEILQDSGDVILEETAGPFPINP